jgi:predicted nucleic acid-binding protein
VSSRVTPERAVTLLSSLERAALSFADPSDVPSVCRDPADAYLFALAHDADAVLVSGDRDVLEVPGPPVRVLTPKAIASLVSRLGA